MRKTSIGLRNLKTALCVLVCMLLTSFFSKLSPFVEQTYMGEVYKLLFVRDTALYSCIAAVISLQSTITLTKKTGAIRIAGTILGGLFSALVLFVNSLFENEFFSCLLIFSAVIIIIYFCNLINRPDYSSVALIMFMIVVFSSADSNAAIQALHRIIDTAGGAAVAFAVNIIIYPPCEASQNKN